MKIIIVMSIAFALGHALETYPTDYDGYDINALVNNPAHMLAVFNCHLDKGPCEPAAKFFKKYIPDAVQSAAAKCTPRQKYIVKVFLTEAQQKFPKETQELMKKYDPKGKYFPALMSALSNA